MKYGRLVFTLFILIYTNKVLAQLDSVRYRIQTQTALSNQGYLPLWIVSNRHGVLEDGTDFLLRAGFEAPYIKGKKFDISYGLDIVGKKDLARSRIQQGFLKVKYGIIEVRGGRIEETINLQHETLSSGSLAQSRNAMPIPKVAITIPEYANVPFTKGYLAFKGYFGHGWLGEDRAVKNVYLHEKNLYLKAGGDLPVNVYGGFVHFAIWGGEDASLGQLPSGFRDYIRVFQGKEAIDEGEDGQFIHEKINALGNHLGIYDFGLVGKFHEYKLSVYHQTPWEDLTSLKLFKSKDRLLGMSIQNSNKKRVVSEVVYEYLFTKYQSGPGHPDPRPGQSNYGFPYGGRDNYYNNGIYTSGWTYKNNIIGTPLFITNIRSGNYFDDLRNSKKSIVSNRVIAHHLGVGGYLGQWISYKALATFTRNYGTYGGLLYRGKDPFAGMDPEIANDYIFYLPMDQVYCLLEFNTVLPFNRNITMQTGIGFDTGKMSKNIGVLFGLQWNGVMKKVLK